MSFHALGLIEPLMRALSEMGYTLPTPVQLQSIPPILAAVDVMAAAQTGTGKTAAFALPLLQRLVGGPGVTANHPRSLVLVPTRELAVQIAEVIGACGKYLSLRTEVVHGGVKINPQMMRMRRGVDVLVATPGRLLDLYRRNAVKFPSVEILILDEADRMLDLGFSEDIQLILTLLPKRRQNLLFSATFPTSVRALAEKLLHKPLRIEVDPPNSAAKNVQHWVYEVDKRKKPELLAHLLQNNDWQQVLVFIRTRDDADRLVGALSGKGIPAVAIHGDKSQGTRSRALADFKAGSIRVLVATDIVARGLDISELSHVINVDLPKVAEDYIHRIGRTGRAGLDGTAISLVSADEVNLLSAIETALHRLLVREVVDGFLPRHSVPLTVLQKARPKKPKKPKKEPVPPQIARQDPPPVGKSIHRKPRRVEAAAGEKPFPAEDGRRHQRSLQKNVVSIKEKKGRGR